VQVDGGNLPVGQLELCDITMSLTDDETLRRPLLPFSHIDFFTQPELDDPDFFLEARTPHTPPCTTLPALRSAPVPCIGAVPGCPGGVGAYPLLSLLLFHRRNHVFKVGAGIQFLGLRYYCPSPPTKKRYTQFGANPLPPTRSPSKS